ncbi:MAG: alginate export family protein [Armatimonadetes bacterium]|nr:alginate export family protein [Armatimonadota bacterium]
MLIYACRFKSVALLRYLAVVILVIALCTAGAADSLVLTTATQPPPKTAPLAQPSPPKKRWLLTGSWRVRQEWWDWFGHTGQDSYTFTGSILRLGATRQTPSEDITLELAQVGLINLPHHATEPAPLGQMGLGAAYFDANDGQDASLFVKQAFWRGKNIGCQANSLRLGRFEFIEGTETIPKDSSLAWLKRERIAHRLIGNFGWSHVQRSFNGLHFARNTPRLNLTLFGGIPTRGVFDLNGMDTLPDVKVAYVAATTPLSGKRSQGEGRLFGIYYEDTRDEVIKADNRPGPVRAADRRAIGIGTIGGHYLGLYDVGSGKVDALLWAAGQLGTWGRQDHGAYAFAVEVGYQPRNSPLKPWVRAGYYRASGDGDPTDDDHQTFFLILPTPRSYARFPFYTLTNLNDAFGQVILRPHPRWAIRTDVHALWLADDSDLWYIGGGAFQDRPSFGFAGRPSNGQSDLATLVDLSVDYQWQQHTTLSFYLGYAIGGDVVRRIYGSSNHGLLLYAEAIRRW